MPKIKAAPPKKVHKAQSDGIILLCKDDILENCEESIQPIKLRHPHSNKAAMFLINADSTKIQEIVAFSEENRFVKYQTLVDREFPETRRLLKCLDAKLLSQVADRKDTYLRYAHGIVSEYLPSSLSSSLLSSLDLPELKPTDPSSKRKLQVSQTLNTEDSEAKRIIGS
ncbi:uncharacterized protein LOC113470002 [Diaphorina citri]|uniref:Uncharacterized protein LOC113470002 n=1 Tax=Diaphorina citri TaxID=121845 RepID=A0A3Q0J617_DIACI|nr:uncharacterized protein LOC113470002 [Diaphorina citri]